MTLYELLDLNISAGTRIDVQLSILITAHLAIFGGIIYVDRPLRHNEKIASLFIYTIFALLNFRIMQNQLDLSDSLVREISKLSADPCCSDNETVNYIAAQLNSGFQPLKEVFLLVGHFVFYIIVLLSILFDKALSKISSPASN